MQIIKKELDIIIFESPASKRTIRYCDHQGKMHSFYLSMPRMRFYSVGEQDAWLTPRLVALYVNFVGSDNLCYPALLPNIGFYGDVCLGDMENVFCEKNIYNSFLSSAFDNHGLLLMEFLFLKFEAEINPFIPTGVSGRDFSFIEFFNLWQKNGLDFQDLNFVNKLKNNIIPNLHCNAGSMCEIDSENELFKTYMSLAQ